MSAEQFELFNNVALSLTTGENNEPSDNSPSTNITTNSTKANETADTSSKCSREGKQINSKTRQKSSSALNVYSPNSQIPAGNSMESLIRDNIRNECGRALIKIVWNQYVAVRAFWCMWLLFAISFSVYLIIGNFILYFEYSVVTTVREFYESPTLFPEVIICNQNLITTQFGFSLSQNASFPADVNSLPDSAKIQLGLWLDDILLSCSFNVMSCSSKDFARFFDRNLGNCYAFNSGNNSMGQTVNSLYALRTGSDYGLRLVWYSSYYELLGVNNTYDGLIVKIVNSSNQNIDEGTFVTPGLVTNIAVERYFQYMMPAPYSACLVPSDFPTSGFSYLFTAIFNSPYEYTQQLCLNLCYQQDVIDKCACNPYDYPFFDGVACADDLCVYNITKKFLATDFLVEKCMPLCPLQCNRTGFYKDVSSSRLNGDGFVSLIQSNANLSVDFVAKAINSENVRDSIACVNVFYDTSTYTYTEETAACDWVCFLANVGGCFGSFVGLSLLSFGEILDALIEICFMYREKKRSASIND